MLQLRGPCIFHYCACIQFFEPASHVRDPACLDVRGFGEREIENGDYEPGLQLQLRECNANIIGHGTSPLKLSHKVLDVLLVLNEAYVRQAKAS